MPPPLTDAPAPPTTPQETTRHARRGTHSTRPAPMPSTAVHADDSGTYGVSTDDLPVWHATDTLPLTAAIAHELRTPMQGLLGTLELLRNTPLTPRQQALLRVGCDAANALMRIANDVLDFTKLRTTQLTLTDEPCDLRGLIDDLIMLLEGHDRSPGVTIEACIDAKLATGIVTDSVRLKQILLNLLTNALKFTDTGKILIRVSVSANHPGAEALDGTSSTRAATGSADASSLSADNPLASAPSSERLPNALRDGDAAHQSITIEVVDSGIGIPEEALAKIWRPFVQVDAHLSRNHEGSGLGLAIARLLASRLGCRLTLESSVGVGTTVRLAACWPIAASVPLPAETVGRRDEGPRDDLDIRTSPMTQGDAVAPAATDAAATIRPPRPATAACAHILVVDDHPTTRVVLQAQLRALGHRVRLAEDAEAAVALLRLRRFDMMLTDCKMPGRDGLALAAAWRHVEAFGALPMQVIGLTANPLPDRALQQGAARFDAYLVKPVTLATLKGLCDIRRFVPSRPTAADGAHRSPRARDARTRSLFASAQAQRPSIPRHAPIDLAKLADIFGCATTVERVLTSFATATLEDLRKIDAALCADRPAITCQRPLHRLTGGLQVLGCYALANLGVTLEQALVIPTGQKRRASIMHAAAMHAYGVPDDGTPPLAYATPGTPGRTDTPLRLSARTRRALGSAIDSPRDQRLKRRLHAFGVQVALCLDWLARQRIR